MSTCPTCQATGDEPCRRPSGRIAATPHVGRPVDPEVAARITEEAAVWEHLTSVQADAVRATAARCLRDPLELAVELFPLLRDRPSAVQATEIPRSTLEMPVVRIRPSVVNEPLTPTSIGVPA